MPHWRSLRNPLFVSKAGLSGDPVESSVIGLDSARLSELFHMKDMSQRESFILDHLGILDTKADERQKRQSASNERAKGKLCGRFTWPL